MAYRGASAELANAQTQEAAGAIPASAPGESVRPQAWNEPPPPAMNERMQQLIEETAAVLQIPPHELATQISYETGGTMNPLQAGPTTQWGQHRGLIQFGEPQAKQYGVDFSSPEAALESQLGKNGAIVKYALANGFKPGEHNGLNLYATINAGDPNKTGATDENNGGAPGTVADKYYNQMGKHAAKFSDIPWGEPGHGQSRTAEGKAIPDEMTPKQKQLAGWQQFAESLSQPKGGGGGAPPVTTSTPTNNVAMMAIPEF